MQINQSHSLLLDSPQQTPQTRYGVMSQSLSSLARPSSQTFSPWELQFLRIVVILVPASHYSAVRSFAVIKRESPQQERNEIRGLFRSESVEPVEENRVIENEIRFKD